MSRIRPLLLSLPLLLALLLLSACEKASVRNTDESGGEEVSGTGNLVSLRVALPANVAHSNEDEEAPPQSIGAYLGHLSIAIFRDGKRLYVSHQHWSDSGFGTYSVRLEEGDYEVVAILHDGLGNATLTKPSEIKFPDNKVTDTFYFYGHLNVSAPLSQVLTLQRATAKVQFRCMDPLPEGLAQMKFYYTGGSSTFDATTGFGCVNSRQTEYREVTEDMIGEYYIFPIYTFPHEQEDELKLVVTALDSAGQTIRETTYNRVTVALNDCTVMEKYFFTQGTAEEEPRLELELLNDADWSLIDRAY